MKKLKALFSPQSIALIGATERVDSVGACLLRNILVSDYTGEVFLVNPKRKTVLGHKTYPTITAVGKEIDLALIVTPAATVPTLLEQCHEAKVKAVAIISGGFHEAGKEGTEIYHQVQKQIKKYPFPILGPNCLGFLNPAVGLNATFASNAPKKKGSIAVISQSGALSTAVLDWADKYGVGFSYFVSTGGMVDIEYDDLIDFFGQDSSTTSILIYMESLTHARRFISAVRAFARNKPIIILKAGRSEGGAAAALRHTGALKSQDFVFEAAFKRAGALRVNTIEDLFDCAQILPLRRLPTNSRLAILTNAGGPGVIAVDDLEARGGKLAKLSQETLAKLDSFLPKLWSRANPVDILGTAGPEQYRKACEVCLKDPGVDSVLVICTPQAMTKAESIAQAVVEVAQKTRKPVLAVWMGESAVESGREILKDGNVPVYRMPENGVNSFMYLYQYKKNLELLYETPPAIPSNFKQHKDKVCQILEGAKQKQKKILDQAEAFDLLKNYDIPVSENKGDPKASKYPLRLAASRDPVFGPILFFGMGGVAAEVFGDVGAGLPPLTMTLAKRLIEETRVDSLFSGHFIDQEISLESLEFLLYKFAYLLVDFPQIKSVELNPLVLDKKQYAVTQAKIEIDLEVLSKQTRPYSHLVISPYPQELIREVTMKEGQKAVLRPIRPEDEPLEAEMFSKLSEETQRFRFFSLIRDITHEQLIRYTQIDYDREMALIAEVESEGQKKMAGVVRLIADAYGESAEFAIVLADAWQGRGLGTLMTDRILEIGKDWGLQKIYAYFLQDNYKMRDIFKARGFEIRNQEGMNYAELKIEKKN